MNNARRKEITRITKLLEGAAAALSEAKEYLEVVRDEEQEAFDSMPESLQQGERGQASEAAIGALEEACGNLDVLDMDSVFSFLEAAAE